MPLPKIKPAIRPTHPSMDKFRALVKAKGWTMEELRDLLRDGVMSDDPPSLGAVRKWVLHLSDPRASKIPAIETFIATFARRGLALGQKPKTEKQDKTP